MTIGITVVLHMGGPGWLNVLYPILFSALSYVAAWLSRNVTYAACGAAINLVVVLILRPFDANWLVCVLYSALWLGAARDVAKMQAP